MTVEEKLFEELDQSYNRLVSRVEYFLDHSNPRIAKMAREIRLQLDTMGDMIEIIDKALDK